VTSNFSGAEPAPLLPGHVAIRVFLSFAFAYFFAAMLRGVTATLAPHFTDELALTAGDLGLLAGAYFLGFAAMQLPLGSALDRFGPRRVLLTLLLIALLGCAAFALARSLLGLTVARGLTGVGVSACLMAPMTFFRHRFAPTAQLRANSWILMTGSMGMVAATLPVDWLLPHIGWRGLFWITAVLIATAMVVIAGLVPADAQGGAANELAVGYGSVFRHRTFLRFAPMGFFHYGGMIAVQSLWAGPWLVQVCRWTPYESAQGLFAINLGMLMSFMIWGSVVPRLFRQGWTAHRLIAYGMPVSAGVLVTATVLGGAATAWVWALFCVASTVGSLSQPAIGQAFPTALAGRALSAYNLVVFAGVFCIQWGIGLVIDVFRELGLSSLVAFQAAFGSLAVCCALSYLWFLALDDGTSLRLRPMTA
jgi:MFS family permease